MPQNYVQIWTFFALFLMILTTFKGFFSGVLEGNSCLISFLMIIVFWGAFEQAGGLMNLYAMQKTDRMLMGFEIPAAVASGFLHTF